MAKHVVEQYAEDLLDDGRLTEDNRSRLVRTARTLGQTAVAAAVLVVGDAVLGVVNGDEPFDPAATGRLAVMAAVSAVVAYFHKRK